MTYFTQYHSTEITSRADPYGGKKDNQLYYKEGPKGKAFLKTVFYRCSILFTLFHELLLIQMFSLETTTLLYQVF